jgi:Mrp family chromosome partitioning ATPase
VVFSAVDHVDIAEICLHVGQALSAQTTGSVCVPINVFLGQDENGLSAEWLDSRLKELRLEFDYTVLHAPPAGLCSEAALLGHLSDGVVLVLQANSTRRVAAQKVKQMLHASNVRLLGTVLNQRTFPIPEAIYKRL